MRAATKDNYFLLDAGPDLPTEREMSPEQKRKTPIYVHKFMFLLS